MYTMIGNTNDRARFAEVLDSVQSDAIMRNIGKLAGSFASKVIKGREYWYYQYTDIDSSLRQIYVGADSDHIRKLISAKRLQSNNDHVKELVLNMIKSGYVATDNKQYKIIKKIADYGFFAAGGVLAGTHAFIAIGNLLGVRWAEEGQTKDVDFAHAGKSIAIVLPTSLKPDLHDAISSLEMGFIPMSAFNGKHAASYVNPESKDERIDFLTTVTGLSLEPVFIKDLNISLQPLKFMELSLSSVDRALVIPSSGNDAVAVNIPNPVFFAIHKLIVAMERGVSDPKSDKDIRQAAAIMDFYVDNDPVLLKDAWDETRLRGSGWSKRMKGGMARLVSNLPSVGAKITAAIKMPDMPKPGF